MDWSHFICFHIFVSFPALSQFVFFVLSNCVTLYVWINVIYNTILGSGDRLATISDILDESRRRKSSTLPVSFKELKAADAEDPTFKSPYSTRRRDTLTTFVWTICMNQSMRMVGHSEQNDVFSPLTEATFSGGPFDECICSFVYSFYS